MITRLVTGMWVRITNGPATGLEGYIQEGPTSVGAIRIANKMPTNPEERPGLWVQAEYVEPANQRPRA